MNFVTGGTGLVGSHIILRLLQENQAILALKRPNSDTSILQKLANHYQLNVDFSQLKWLEGNLDNTTTLYAACAQATHVFHAAAMVSFQKKDREQLLNINYRGTRNLVNASIEKGVEEFVFLSSTAAVGNSGKTQLTEKSEWKESESSNYGISKRMAELEVWRGSEEGLKTVIVNPSIIIGPGNWGKSSTSLFSTIDEGLSFYPPGTNGFVSVHDVVNAIWQLREQKIYNERFLLVAENKPFQWVFEQIAEQLHKKAPSVRATKPMLYAALFADRITSWILQKDQKITRETVASALRNTHYSNEKIKNRLGFSFTPLQQAIRETAAIYLADKK